MPNISFNLTMPMTCGIIGGVGGLAVGHYFDRETRGAMIPAPGKLFFGIGGFCVGYTVGMGLHSGWRYSEKWRSKWK